jgi:hypothetical protein
VEVININILFSCSQLKPLFFWLKGSIYGAKQQQQQQQQKKVCPNEQRDPRVPIGMDNEDKRKTLEFTPPTHFIDPCSKEKEHECTNALSKRLEKNELKKKQVFEYLIISLLGCCYVSCPPF